MSDEITKANQTSEELSDDELDAVAGGSNSALIGQIGSAINNGSGTAINIEITIINQIDISAPSSGGGRHSPHHHPKHY